jgi:hypothetical protein
MKFINRSPAVKWIVLSLLLLVSVGPGPGTSKQRADATSASARRMSPDLLREPLLDRVRVGDGQFAGDGIMVGDRFTFSDAGRQRSPAVGTAERACCAR